EVQLFRSGILIAVGAKQRSSFGGAAHHISLLELFEIFQCICYKRFAPMGLVFVQANLKPNTIGNEHKQE
ncbi:MAG: hypothetical protein DME76_12445, partial [Verrucomicrobia bacterium]